MPPDVSGCRHGLEYNAAGKRNEYCQLVSSSSDVTISLAWLQGCASISNTAAAPSPKIVARQRHHRPPAAAEMEKGLAVSLVTAVPPASIQSASTLPAATPAWSGYRGDRSPRAPPARYRLFRRACRGLAQVPTVSGRIKRIPTRAPSSMPQQIAVIFRCHKQSMPRQVRLNGLQPAQIKGHQRHHRDWRPAGRCQAVSPTASINVGRSSRAIRPHPPRHSRTAQSPAENVPSLAKPFSISSYARIALATAVPADHRPGQ